MQDLLQAQKAGGGGVPEASDAKADMSRKTQEVTLLRKMATATAAQDNGQYRPASAWTGGGATR